MNDPAQRPARINREQELEITLRAVLQCFRDCDSSNNKSHPWIPGSEAIRIVPRIIATLDLCYPGENNTGI